VNTKQVHDEESVQNVGPSRIKVVYQRFGDPASPPVFLIMGGGAQMIAWPEGFCIELANQLTSNISSQEKMEQTN
jgi:hypothetical protein